MTLRHRRATVVRRIARGTIAPALTRAGRASMPCATRAEALAAAEQLTDHGYVVTLGYWRSPDDPPTVVRDENLACLASLRQFDGRTWLAVKAPALGLDAGSVDELACSAGPETGLIFDAHGPEQVDATFALARRARAGGATVGLALSTRWERSTADTGVAMAEGMAVRLVKGQFDGPSGGDPLASEKTLRASFLALVDRFAVSHSPVSLATHDHVLLDAALGRLAHTGTQGTVELLFGRPARRSLVVASEHRAPVHFYIPYGHPWLSYTVRSARRRPRLAIDLARGTLLGPDTGRRRLSEALGVSPGLDRSSS